MSNLAILGMDSSRHCYGYYDSRSCSSRHCHGTRIPVVAVVGTTTIWGITAVAFVATTTVRAVPVVVAVVTSTGTGMPVVIVPFFLIFSVSPARHIPVSLSTFDISLYVRSVVLASQQMWPLRCTARS